MTPEGNDLIERLKEFETLRSRLEARYEWADADRVFRIADQLLGPCPFCGSMGAKIVGFSPLCFECKAHGPTGVDNTFAGYDARATHDHRHWRTVCSAVDLWNRRAPDPEAATALSKAQAEGEELRARIKELEEGLRFYADNWDWFPGDGENPTESHPGSPPTFYEAEPNATMRADEGNRARHLIQGDRGL